MNEKATFSKVVVLLVSMVFLVSAFATLPASYIESEQSLEETASEDIRSPSGTRAGSNRTVLVELFTNAGCPPCANANPPLNDLIDVFGPEKMIMIGYHGNFPDPNDPFYLDNPFEEDAREAYYFGDETSTGYPSMEWDGVIEQVGAGADRIANYNTYKTNTQTRLAISSPISITLSGSMNSTDGTVDYTIEATDLLPGGDLKIRFAVTEDNRYFPGSNGEVRHRKVFRDMLIEDSLPALMIGGQHIGSRSFTIEPFWSRENLEIVVFVQNDVGWEVLQSAVYDYIPQEILVIDDDAGTHPDGDEDGYHETLTFGDWAFDGWALDESGSPSVALLSNYKVVIWETGSASTNTLTSTDQTAISTYLDTTTGSLFVVGENIGADLNGTSFYNNYLYATMGRENTGMPSVKGISGDPISDSFWNTDLTILSSSPSEISPVNGGTQTFFYAGMVMGAAVKAEHDADSRLVYFAYKYFEGGDPDTQKRSVMVAVLNWLMTEPMTIDLEEGYNFISIPNFQIVPTLDSVFDSISGEYDAVQRYDVMDQNDPWKHWMESKPAGWNDLDYIEHTMGLWIRVTASGGTTFFCNGTQPTADEYVDLFIGWNMVGYPSLTTRDRDSALNNLIFDVDVDAIWTYDAALDQWIELGPSDNFETGRGYMIHSLFDNTWTVPK